MMIPPHNLVHQSASKSAFTLIELLFVISIIGILAALLFPSLAHARKKAVRTHCVSNIRQVNLGVQMWLHDNTDLLPWQINTGRGGSKGETATYAHWKILSNHLSSPKILMCPGMAKYRNASVTFARLTSDKNVAYAVGTHSTSIRAYDETRGINESIVATDMDASTSPTGNSTGKCPPAGNIVALSFTGEFGDAKSYTAVWSRTNHVSSGQISTVGGSIFLADNRMLRQQISAADFRRAFHLLPPDFVP